MNPLRYREYVSDERNTCVVREDGPVILVIANIHRTDVAQPMPVILPCWYMQRGRIVPTYERPVFPMRRLQAESVVILGVPFGPGDREDIYVVGIPEVRINNWCRSAFVAAARGHD